MAVVDVDSADETNVAAGAALRAFARAVLRDDRAGCAAARAALCAAVGPRGVTDAAGVVAQFESINRIADATGVRLDEVMEQAIPAMLDGVDLSAMSPR